MEAGRNMLSSSPSFPLRTHLRNGPSSSSSVSVLHEKATFAVTSAPNSTTSLSRLFPTSVHLQEQRDESRTSLHLSKEERTPQVRPVSFSLSFSSSSSSSSFFIFFFLFSRFFF